MRAALQAVCQASVTCRASAARLATAIRQVGAARPGIPAELQPALFERFVRGDSSRSRAAGSTGLGLAIVEAVVSAHRGHVEVTSQPGRTVFAISLPLPDISPGPAH